MTFYKLYDLGLSNYFICVVELYGDTIARVWGNMITIKKKKNDKWSETGMFANRLLTITVFIAYK